MFQTIEFERAITAKRVNARLAGLQNEKKRLGWTPIASALENESVMGNDARGARGCRPTVIPRMTRGGRADAAPP
jgi:hypothetical protein